MLVIDPGDFPEHYETLLNNKGQSLVAVMATHGHIDHILGAAAICLQYHCPFIMNGEDYDNVRMLEATCERFHMPYYGTPDLDIDLSDKHEISLGSFHIRIIHTPGHTRGGLCFMINDQLFSGDTLFYRSIGRTDLPGGDHSQLILSIKKGLFGLPDMTPVYPGHGQKTSIGEEKKHNPFIVL